jgi:hypothetical protein
MSGIVEVALREQAAHTRNRSRFVFCARNGGALLHRKVTKRVW